MFSSSRWIRSVLQLAVIVVVIAGGAMMLRAKQAGSGSLGRDVAEHARTPDPETPGSLLKLKVGGGESDSCRRHPNGPGDLCAR